MRRFYSLLSVAALLGSCAGLPPGSNYPRSGSVAFSQPGNTHVGLQLATAIHEHEGNSAYRMISVGADGFAARMQMIDAADKSLDLQYFIFRGDDTGRLLTGALLHAADRGVHIRLLVDDGQTTAGDEQLNSLAAHPQVEIRIFNPFAYRGHGKFGRGFEFIFNARRLNYRMHNKLLVADNINALIGGRNIGDQYFQIDPDAQFADDDVYVAGPMAQKLSASFDEFWNSALAIPVQALSGGKSSEALLANHRVQLATQLQQAQADGVDYLRRAASGDPVNGILANRLPLIWTSAQVLYDSPNKKRTRDGSMIGRLMYDPVAQAAAAVTTELLMITPYLVPSAEEMQLLIKLRQRNVRVRILTSSLEATGDVLAHSGYIQYRQQLVRAGVELYEVRAMLGANSRGSGQTAAVSRHGNYGLHAKLFVFDRRRLFVGSMNFDQRSLRLNTEIGLLIDSPEMSEQTVARFDAMTQPGSAYFVTLGAAVAGRQPLVWRTQEAGKAVEYGREPSPSVWKRLEVRILSMLPLKSQL